MLREEKEFLFGVPSIFLLLEEVARQFILVDLDECDLAAWLTKTRPAGRALVTPETLVF